MMTSVGGTHIRCFSFSSIGEIVANILTGKVRDEKQQNILLNSYAKSKKYLRLVYSLWNKRKYAYTLYKILTKFKDI